MHYIILFTQLFFRFTFSMVPGPMLNFLFIMDLFILKTKMTDCASSWVSVSCYTLFKAGLCKAGTGPSPDGECRLHFTLHIMYFYNQC